MFNAIGFSCLLWYAWLRIYDWIILEIVPFADWKEFVLLGVSSLFLFIKAGKMAIDLYHYNRKVKQDRKIRDLEIEREELEIDQMRRGGARGKDFDENQITG